MKLSSGDSGMVKSVSGTVAFASANPKTRVVLQPTSGGKRYVVSFREPVRLNKGQAVTVRGQITSEGYQSIVLSDSELIRILGRD